MASEISIKKDGRITQLVGDLVGEIFRVGVRVGVRDAGGRFNCQLQTFSNFYYNLSSFVLMTGQFSCSHINNLYIFYKPSRDLLKTHQ